MFSYFSLVNEFLDNISQTSLFVLNTPNIIEDIKDINVWIAIEDLMARNMKEKTNT